MVIVYLSLRNQRCGHTYETGRHGRGQALASTHGVIVAVGGGADVLPSRQSDNQVYRHFQAGCWIQAQKTEKELQNIIIANIQSEEEDCI